MLAHKTGCPVIPVSVRDGTSILPCGTTFPRAGHARVRFGEPLFIGRDETAAAFSDRLRERVRELGQLVGAVAVNGAPRPA